MPALISSFLDGFNIVEFHDDGNFNTSSTQDFVGGLSGGNVFLEGKTSVAQVLHGEIFFLGEGCSGSSPRRARPEQS